MYYLQCGHCAGYSALKSEYVTFCDHCGKKLKHTYADWKAHHPEGTFAAFEQTAGIPEAVYEKAVNRRPHWLLRLRHKAALITVLVVLICCSALGAWYGPSLVKMFRRASVPESMVHTTQWRTFRGNVIRVQTPLSLSPAARSDEPGRRIKRFEGGGASDGLEIRMEETVFLSSAQIDRNESARDVLTGLGREKGVSGFTFREQPLEVGADTAMWQQGSFILDHATAMEFQQLVMVRGGSRVQLLVCHQGNDENGRKVAEAIIRSARMN
ncbi:hypothetical protein ACWKWU_14520 [Chitinophaga lutea]